MENTFFGCSKLNSINLSSFDTSSVENMQSMFNGCSNLTSLEFSNLFDTSSVTNMDSMFKDCKSITSINLSMFNTSSVEFFFICFQDVQI